MILVFGIINAVNNPIESEKMNHHLLSLKTPLYLAAFLLGLFLCPTLDAAVTFTFTPAAVSNTYGGRITLQINGLASGDTVVVQKFLDLNTHCVVDAGAWLLHHFTP